MEVSARASMILVLSCFTALLSVQCGAAEPGLQPSTKSGPCADEKSWSDSPIPPTCDDSDGSYEPKQCNEITGECWCVGACGDEIEGTRDAAATVKCRADIPPCEKAYEESKDQRLLGAFRGPRCRPDGFYYHTQCLEASCYCVDRCGNEVPDSRHHIARIRERLCACPDDSHAYNCPINPCQDAVCGDFPEAICRPTICGGCVAEFSVDGSVVDCGPGVCRDLNNNIIRHGNEFRPTADHCIDCTCLDGETVCPIVDCPPPSGPGCTPTYEEGACCPTYTCDPEVPIGPEEPIIVGRCSYFCTRDIQPVCGTDGNTYTNECEMGRMGCQQEIEITLDYGGDCQPDGPPEPPHPVIAKCDMFACSTLYEPVCGTDGDTYDNRCILQRTACENNVDIVFDHDGPCVSTCTRECPNDYDPVCGSDGRTYSNECAMEVTACENNNEITVDHIGDCHSRTPLNPAVRDCEEFCTSFYDPVCGTDGDTYHNECKMRSAACLNDVDIVVAHTGICVPPCIDRQGRSRSPGESWTDPDDICIQCDCGTFGRFPACVSASCAGKPHKFCTAPPGEEVCCPNWICPRGCIDDDDNFRQPGESWESSACVTCSCPDTKVTSQVSGLLMIQSCEIKKGCSPPEKSSAGGHVGECPPSPQVGGEAGAGICAFQCEDDIGCGDTEKCCTTACGGKSCMEAIQVQPPEPLLPVLPSECTDYQGKTRTVGETWTDPEDNCLTCSCESGAGVPVCFSPSCPGKPNPFCTAADENVCCTDWICPQGCIDTDNNFRQPGESWKPDPSQTCVCPELESGVDPLSSGGGVMIFSCTTKDPSSIIQLPSGCSDRQGNNWPLGESWTDSEDVCLSCTCVSGGIPICSSPSCLGKPHKFCTAPSEGKVCCPDWSCPSGCIDAADNFRQPGESWEPDPCQTCSCPKLEPGIGPLSTRGELTLYKCVLKGKCISPENVRKCPPVNEEASAVGTCAFTCEDDLGCSSNEMCCPTACGGRSCVDIEGPPPDSLPSGCTDRQGLTRAIGDTWTDPKDNCVTCSCESGGVPACFSTSCLGRPHQFCTPSDEDVCCPDWICPRGCIDGENFRQPGESWEQNPCLTCSCPALEPGVEPVSGIGEISIFQCLVKETAQCLPVPPQDDTCIDNEGNTRAIGDSSYLGPDGCNQCSCTPEGPVCTYKACIPPMPEPETPPQNEFVFSYPHPRSLAYDDVVYTPYILITTASETGVKVRISSAYTNELALVSASNPANITLSERDYLGEHTSTMNNTVIVRANGEVNVHGMSTSRTSSDGFLVQPSNRLDTRYLIASYPVLSDIPMDTGDEFTPAYSEVAVSALDEETEITITASKGAVLAQLTLEAYQTFQLLSNEDLTGALVEANKRVSVMAGSNCAWIPNVYNYHSLCGLMLENLPGVSTYGTDFVLAPFLGRESGYVYRIVAEQDTTSVTISGASAINLNAQRFHEGDVTGNDMVFIQSDKPVLVVQYSKDWDTDMNGVGAPSMVVVPPTTDTVQSGTRSLVFPVTNLFTSRPQTTYVTVIIRCDNVEGLLLDGSVTEWDTVTIGQQTRVCGLRKAVPVGVHELSHLSSDATFDSVQVYGFSRYNAYSYDAGFVSISDTVEPIIVRDGTCPPVDPKETSGICANICENDGACPEKQKCCPTACGGSRCEETRSSPIRTGPCNPNRCENGGECQVKWRVLFTCLCPDGFTGRRCQFGPVCRDALGNEYQEGAEFTSRAGCTTCRCVNGEIVCPEPSCPVQPRVPGVACSVEGPTPAGCCPTEYCNILCPPGSIQAKCIADPCEAVCPQYPEAKCLPSYCGGCNAVFYGSDGYEIDCYKPACPATDTTSCTQNPCNTASCPANPRATCHSNFDTCNGCDVIFYDENNNEQVCDPIPIETGPCYPNPCLNGGTCAVRFRISHRCTCAPRFTGLQCQTMECTPENPQVSCFTDPCNENSCPAYPDARCRPNFCGDCNAVYFDDNGNAVNCNEPGCQDGEIFRQPGEVWKSSSCVTCSCPDGPAEPGQFNLRPILCDAQACPLYDLTPGCTYVPPTEDECCGTVDCGPQEVRRGCLDGETFRQPGEIWKPDPCLTCSCPDTPGQEPFIPIACEPAACPQYQLSGNCQYVPPSPDECCGNVQCPEEPQDECPPGIPVVNCFADPCSVTTCPADSTAICVTNYCGDCNAIYYDSLGEEVDCLISADDCIDRNGNRVRQFETYRPSGACMECTCMAGQPLCPVVDCFNPPNWSFCTSESSPDECCPRYDCPEGCVDRPGAMRTFNEGYEDGCEYCTCDRSGHTTCRPLIPCPKYHGIITPGCELVVNPPAAGLCCPEQVVSCPSVFVEDPVDSFVVRYSQPVTLTCSAEIPRQELLSFECNGQVIESGLVEYIPEREGVIAASIDVSRTHIEEHTGEDKFWCQCVAVTEDQQTYRSEKAYVAISYIRKYFDLEPSSIEATVGETIILHCIPPAGLPTPTVTWEKDGQVLDVSTNPRYVVADGGNLEISGVETVDAGNYACVAKNIAKTRKSGVAVVTVA